MQNHTNTAYFEILALSHSRRVNVCAAPWWKIIRFDNVNGMLSKTIAKHETRSILRQDVTKVNPLATACQEELPQDG